jgi:isopenicillin N synthase-like dioxygenase
MEVPIINFADMDLAVSRRMDKAFREVGFAVFTNVYDRWMTDFDLWELSIKEFFDLPPEVKSKYAYSGVEKNLGYSEVESEWLHPDRPGDLKEAYNWKAPYDMENKYWPTELPLFRTQAEKIERIMRVLSFEFMDRFELALGLKKGFLVEKHLYGTTTARILHYPKVTSIVKDQQLRGNEHTDYDTFTMLFRFQDCGGLFVKTIQGDWVEVPVIENSVVLNIADMFQRWTNDRYVSTPHRVMNVLDRTRYSMPYFVGPNKDTIVKNLTDEPDKYDPISSYEYLLWRLGQSY